MNEDIKPEVCIATKVCPFPELWHCYDEQATEVEVLDFLYALVIMLKPRRVVETGCYNGFGTERLAKGCRENGFGVLYTCDISKEQVDNTVSRLKQGGYQGIIVNQCSGIQLIHTVAGAVDLAFLDSGPDENRCDELRALYLKISPGGVVALHDTGIHGFLREKYLPPLLRELNMQYIYFDTPRGITLCRKQPEIYP